MHRPQPLAPPASLDDVASLVTARISETLDREAARWEEVDADLAAPLSSLRQLVLSGGKRLRPAFCWWAFVGMGGDPGDPLVVDGGAALELLHTFALIHDDVMDASARRHGVDTVHVEHGDRHATEGWRGSADRFGTGVAILVGDLASVYSDRFLTRAPAAAKEVFDELRLEVNVGQYLDLVGTARRGTSPEAARRVCQYKSGKYTVERPLHLGAALAAPDELPAVAGPLSSYGMPLGEAFQLKDDLLGVFGDPARTGKPVGEDLREGKPTLLYALARAAASGAEMALLDRRFGSPDLRPDEVSAMQDVFERSGARDRVDAIVERLVGDAIDAADRLPLQPAACAALRDLARFVAGRDH